MAVAMLAAVMMTVLTAGSVLAQGHVANDGQTLEMQSPEVQAIYASVWGDNAAMQWAADHNAAIGQVAPQAQHPRYDEVFHVAYMRSMDMELAGRITADVIARGTIDQFMAGTDMGVLYGYVAPAPQPAAAPSAPSSSSSSTSSAPSTPETLSVSGWMSPRSVYYEVGQTFSLTLPTAPGASSYELTVTSADEPVWLARNPLTRTVSGRPTAATEDTPVALMYTAKGEDGATVLDVLDEEYTLTLMIHVRDADLQPLFTDADAVDSVSITEGVALAADAVVLPVARGGNTPVAYEVTGLPTGFVPQDPDGTTVGGITGGADAAVGMYPITLTATDADGDTASLSFTITVEKDVVPSVPDIGDMTFTAGDRVEVQLPAGSGGNGPLTYELAGQPGGLMFSNQRYLHGNLAEGLDDMRVLVTYTVTDSDEDSAVEGFYITINAIPVE